MAKGKTMGMITLATMLIGTLLLPGAAVGDAPSNNPSQERVIATYGGYGISRLALGDEMIFAWGTMGDVLVDITFRGDEAKGVIILGDTKYKVELELTDDDLVADGTTIVHQSIEGGRLYEGRILNYEGEVKLVRYQDVVVGEIDLGKIIYRFDVAGYLYSAGTILVLHNDEYVERLLEIGILQLPEMPPLAPPVEPDEIEELRLICPQTHYVPSLKELLAAGDDDIVWLLVTEPHRVEELRELSKLNPHVLTLIGKYALSHIEQDKGIEQITKLLRGIVSAEDNSAYLAELEGQSVEPNGGGGKPPCPDTRFVSVRPAADEEFQRHHGSVWRAIMTSRIERADNAFESEFRINFWVSGHAEWRSDAHGTLRAIFDEMRREVSHWCGSRHHDVVPGFTHHNTGCGYLGLAERPGDDAITKEHQHVVRIIWHEFSHLFGCTCFATEPHPEGCIMSMWWLTATGWCTEGPNCHRVISDNKWRRF